MITSIPTVIIENNGKIVDMIIGNGKEVWKLIKNMD